MTFWGHIECGYCGELGHSSLSCEQAEFNAEAAQELREDMARDDSIFD